MRPRALDPSTAPGSRTVPIERSRAVISRFFIDRPIFAVVISVVFVLAGGVAVFTLPVAQYPDVTPPTVLVTALYPGANAQTVRDTVAAPIEEQVSGVEDMLYMSSQCTNDGAYTLTVTFRLGMDTDMAQVLVQNRVSLALPVIPALVQNEGISVKKMSPNTLMIVNLISPDGRYDSTFLSNYATIYIKDELGRLPGVAGITYLGQRDYSLRAWLDPDKLAALNLSAHGRRQRHRPAEPPGRRRPDRPAARPRRPAVPAHDQHPGPAHRARAVRRHHPQGRPTDDPAVAHDLAAERPARSRRRSRTGRPRRPPRRSRRPPASSASATWPASSSARSSTTSPAPSTASPRSRSRSTSCPAPTPWTPPSGVYAKMKELKTRFPDGLDYKIVYDTTPFIRESVNEVFKTLRDAVILVGIVVLVFLQDWRAMILPMIDVPVSLDRHLRRHGRHGLQPEQPHALRPGAGHRHRGRRRHRRAREHRAADRHRPDARTATIKAMEEITGPILAITLVLSSVFVPCCFLGGITGQFFRQFAVTIAVSTIISAVNAMTMTPSRAVLIFKTEPGTDGHGTARVQREALPWWFFAIVGGAAHGLATDRCICRSTWARP